MYAFVFVVLTILIYYFFFVHPLPHDKTMFAPDAHYVKPPYEFRLERDGIRITGGGSAWIFPPLPPQFRIDNDRIIEWSHCAGRKDGELIPASDRSVYAYIKRHTPYMARSNSSPVYDIYSKLDYYFECRDDREFKLFYCPLGTIFDNGACVSSDICRRKPDGYRYTVPGISKTYFYECSNGRGRLEYCPFGEIFDRLLGTCVPPLDPCELLKDDQLLEYDRQSYTVCRNGRSNKRYCSDNEYFIPAKRLCTSTICENNDKDEPVPISKTDGAFRYDHAYTICTAGVATDRKDCPSAYVDPVGDMDLYYRLPQTLVYGDSGICEPPRLCVNVFPRHDYVPGNKFQTAMQNYRFGSFYDSLYGYACDLDRPKKVDFPPGRYLDEEGRLQTCSGNRKIPVLHDASSFFDCAKGVTEPCPNDPDDVFDFGLESCVPLTNGRAEEFHTFENIPVFKTTGLQDNNWFGKRKRRTDPDKICKPNQVFEAGYNVCADSRCQHLGVLSQLPGKRLYVDDDYVCLEQNGEIVAKRYNESQVVHLDFWRQKITYSVPVVQYCKKGSTRLESTDFVLNSILYPTCSADFATEDPFVVCPSTMTERIVGTPTLCYPPWNREKIYWEYLDPQNDYVYFNKIELQNLEVLTDQTSITMLDKTDTDDDVTKTTVHAAGELVPVYNYNKQNTKIGILADRRIQINKTNISTNYPYHFIHHDGRKSRHYISDDFLKYTYPIKLEMEKFTIEKSLSGFAYAL